MRKPKLKTHLFINIILFAVLIFIVMAVILIVFATNTIENMVYDKTDETMRIIEVEMEHYLEHPLEELMIIRDLTNEVLNTKGTFEEDKAFTIEYSEKAILTMELLEDINRFDVLNEDGLVITTLPYSEGIIGFDLCENNIYKKVKYSQEDYVLGEMIIDPFLNSPIMYISMKLDDGYLVGYLNLETIQEMLQNVVVDDSHIAVIDEYGTYMSHTSKELVEQRVVDPLAKKIRDGNIDNRSKVMYQGSEYLLQFVEIKNTNWYILYYQDIEIINQPVTKSAFTIVLIFFLLFPILIHLLFRIIKLVNASLDDLVYATKNVAIGDYNIEDTDFHYEEFNYLFESVKYMSKEVSEREEEVVSLNQELENNYYTMIVLLAKAIEAKDNYTGNHCERVRDYSMLMGQGLGLSSKDLMDLKFGATLHDIGKLGISELILNKPGKFTDEEYEVIKGHSQLGFDIMEEMPSMVAAKKIILHHHERMDGHGYPYGLKGNEIPLLARIVSVADAFDAMTSERPYRKHHMTQKEGFIELRRSAGTQFDGQLVEVFIEMVKREASKI